MNWLKRIFTKHDAPTPEAMINFMLNKSEDLGGRDDCAMDLSQFDLPEVEKALIKVATDHSEDEMIIDSAGESLQEIWNRQKRVPPKEVLEKVFNIQS